MLGNYTLLSFIIKPSMASLSCAGYLTVIVLHASDQFQNIMHCDRQYIVVSTVEALIYLMMICLFSSSAKFES